MKWNNMDTEPIESGVILYSARNNRIYDATYIGEGRFDINGLTVSKGDFDRWMQRDAFFNETGIMESGIMEPVVETKSGTKDDISNGHDDVDLGLPSGLLWATCNVGASQPQEYGKYFQWGDTEGYYNGMTEAADHSYWDTCPWGKRTPLITRLDLEHDAARANMGGKWRMPTRADFNELYQNTTSCWTSVSGVNGMRFTNRSNPSKSIFIPAAGYYNSGSFYSAGSYGFVWCSSINPSVTDNAYSMYFYHWFVSPYSNNSRCCGFSVRGVIEVTTQHPSLSWRLC